MGKGNFQQNLYIPINREKYKGAQLPYFRSSYEKKLMCFFDKHPNVIAWVSEPFAIAYFNPVKGKITRYYPDFLVTYRGQDGLDHTELIEVKPYRQTIPPVVSKGKRHSTILIEGRMWAINKAKWEAAKKYCQDRNITFRIMTEKELSIR